MYTFFVQLLDLVYYGNLHYFVLFFLWVWFVWFMRAVPSLRYHPFTEPHTETVTVLIPVCDEPEDLFEEVIRRIVRQSPLQVIVIINGPQNPKLERICRKYPLVSVIWTPEAGKRNAVRLGLEKAKGSVCFLVDSDTLWEDNVLTELVKPFADPKVGGVTTRQRIYRPERSLITGIADWLEDIRGALSMRSMSVFGTVGCLPGRTIAFRTSILKKAVPLFMEEKFLGVHLEISDDRALTNYTLRFGYKTVYQSTALVFTDAPTHWSRYIRQQKRWSEGSQYNSLKMMPWMLTHTPYLAFLYLSEIVTPFFLIGVILNAFERIVSGTGYSSIYNNPWFELLDFQIMLIFLGAVTSIGLRQYKHLRDKPMDLLILPAFIAVLTFILTPVRIWGFFVMALKDPWGTRSGECSVPEEEGRSFNARGLVPFLIGGLFLAGFIGLGPAVEGRALFPHQEPVFTSDRISLGVYTYPKTVEEREREAGVRFNHVLLYQNIKSIRYDIVQGYLDKGYDVILNVTFFDDHANLKEIKDGAYDTYLIDLAEKIKKDGRPIWLRTLHEFNGHWFNWAVLYRGNSRDDFIPAWKHVVGIFRDRNVPVKVQLNYNRLNGFDKKLKINDTTPFVEFYPGDDWVDMVVITTYNRAYTDPYHRYWRSFDEEFEGAYDQILAMTDKPVGIAEMGTTSYGGDKPGWIVDAFVYIKYKYTKVVEVTWFLYNRPESGVTWDWDLNSSKDVAAFRKGISILERKDGSSEGGGSGRLRAQGGMSP